LTANETQHRLQSLTMRGFVENIGDGDSPSPKYRLSVWCQLFFPLGDNYNSRFLVGMSPLSRASPRGEAAGHEMLFSFLLVLFGLFEAIAR
jgi:hypothetical protein